MALHTHIQHFYKDGESGDYYAQFYTAVALSLKKQWPKLKIGGPVSQPLYHVIGLTIINVAGFVGCANWALHYTVWL